MMGTVDRVVAYGGHLVKIDALVAVTIQFLGLLVCWHHLSVDDGKSPTPLLHASHSICQISVCAIQNNINQLLFLWDF